MSAKRFLAQFSWLEATILGRFGEVVLSSYKNKIIFWSIDSFF